jgi:O-antigen/teichoic acid export membrane protein
MDIIEKFISKFLDKIAKTKEDSLLFGGLFFGFALGAAIFGLEDTFDFDLIDIFKILIVSILLFSGVLLIARGRK